MGLALGVATNDAEAPARAHLAAVGQEHAFDFIAGYDSGFGGKPGPGMCLGFAKAVGLVPEHVLMVGDSTHDLEAGRAAGMRTVAVLTGMAEAEVLAPIGDGGAARYRASAELDRGAADGRRDGLRVREPPAGVFLNQRWVG